MSYFTLLHQLSYVARESSDDLSLCQCFDSVDASSQSKQGDMTQTAE